MSQTTYRNRSKRAPSDKTTHNADSACCDLCAAAPVAGCRSAGSGVLAAPRDRPTLALAARWWSAWAWSALRGRPADVWGAPDPRATSLGWFAGTGSGAGLVRIEVIPSRGGHRPRSGGPPGGFTGRGDVVPRPSGGGRGGPEPGGQVPGRDAGPGRRTISRAAILMAPCLGSRSVRCLAWYRANAGRG